MSVRIDKVRQAIAREGVEGLALYEVEALVDLVELQTRALLAVEWSAKTMINEWDRCPSCGGARRLEEGERVGHADCLIDASLTAAGLDTQEKRDAARQRTR